MSDADPLRAAVSVESFVDPPTARRLYGLYLDSFGELAIRAVARQVLHEEEFLAAMADERVDKYLARDAGGEVLAMCTLTRHLETVPWISPEYFRHHYPEHAARDAIYYLGFILVAPQARRHLVFREMVRMVAERLVDQRAMCGYDVCAWNADELGLGGSIATVLSEVADIDVDAVDTQVYYRAVPLGPRRTEA